MIEIEQKNFLSDPIKFLRKAAEGKLIKVKLPKEIGPFKFEGDVVITSEENLKEEKKCKSLTKKV